MWLTCATMRFELWQYGSGSQSTEGTVTVITDWHIAEILPFQTYKDVLVVMNRPHCMWSCHLKLSSGLIKNHVLPCADLWNLLLLLWQRRMLSVSPVWVAAIHSVSLPNSPCLSVLSILMYSPPTQLSLLLVYLSCTCTKPHRQASLL